jgi:lysophospholipase L1-like esterase
MKAVLLLASALAPMVCAQLVDDYKPPRGACCLEGTAQRLADQLQDWNQLGRYYADNQAVRRAPADPSRVVFMGDSITDNWKLTDSFPGKPFLNRGIGGQVTSQMVVRFYPDVIDLKPAVVVILAGTNDIARNNGPSTLEQIEENFEAMTELAQLHGIKVVLCALTPVSDYARTPMTPGRPPADILKLNAWIKDYASKTHAVYADYYSAIVDDKGMLKNGFSMDGLHPNPEGYKLLAPVAEAAIQKALQ